MTPLDRQSETLQRLAAGPECRSVLGISYEEAHAMADAGLIKIDPDRWPDEYVPGNPMVLRLPDDDTRWPGWDRWNV